MERAETHRVKKTPVKPETGGVVCSGGVEPDYMWTGAEVSLRLTEITSVH